MVYGANLIGQALHDLGVQVVFGLPGLPVIDIGQACIDRNIRFISFRNEQAAVYAATAYGYLTGKPGVCISVGGPGVLHVMTGIPHAMANAWPLLVLAGSSETHNSGRAAFQEMDAIPLITPMAKMAVRPPYPYLVPKFIKDAYRTAMYGKPGPTFVDLPADFILGHFDLDRLQLTPLPEEAPKSCAPDNKIRDVVAALKSAKAPLVVIGKGAAYARAEKPIRALIEQTGISFVPTPMAKGLVPDSSPHNVSAARSTALKEADVVLVLSARLNWILSFGLPPKWNPHAKIIQVDISGDELGKNNGDPSLALVGDVGLITEQIVAGLHGWRWQGQSSQFYKTVQAAKTRNEDRAARKAAVKKVPMTYEHVYDVIKRTLDSLSDPSDGNVVYVSEGANAMDIARSIFTMENPRCRLDAGTYATMGVGPSYAIAAHAAYNFPRPEGLTNPSTLQQRKKIVCIEGDSAFGFTAMEVETMGRYQMDILVFVINNSGIYRGDSEDSTKWKARQHNTAITGQTANGQGLSALSLGFETAYHKIAEVAGGEGYVVRTPEELERATTRGFHAKVPVVVNVIVDQQSDLVMDFSWLDMAPPPQKKEAKL